MEPSKVYGVLAAARPALVAVEQESEPARIVEEVGCGVLIDPDDADALAAAISDLAGRDSAELRRMGEAGRAYAEEWCVRERSTQAYREVFASVSS
jgi:glycosyltransferase involved in cell wall biosynthesis